MPESLNDQITAFVTAAENVRNRADRGLPHPHGADRGGPNLLELRDQVRSQAVTIRVLADLIVRLGRVLEERYRHG
jgi:hypothetical protein